jgi:type I restriction enzyme R subunit
MATSGAPEQKTIIFCVRDSHADEVANKLNNIYTEWCGLNGKTPVQDYAFKCTADSGKEYLSEIRGSSRHHFIATTVDLLTTGVDVPPVVNIVFFKYVNSPISFYQMVGRGTRLHAPTNKLSFTVYDYTNATRLFGRDFITKVGVPTGPRNGPITPPDATLVVEDIEVRVSHAGTYILTTDESGEAVPVTLEEYKSKMAERLVEEAASLDEFREMWVEPERRREMISQLPDAGRAPLVIRKITDMDDYDLYDVIGEIGYGLAPKTMEDRAGAFEYKNRLWLDAMDASSSGVIRAIASQFAMGGTNTLENPDIFSTPAVVQAGGVSSLRMYGDPEDAYTETKQRMFAA